MYENYLGIQINLTSSGHDRIKQIRFILSNRTVDKTPETTIFRHWIGVPKKTSEKHEPRFHSLPGWCAKGRELVKTWQCLAILLSRGDSVHEGQSGRFYGGSNTGGEVAEQRKLQRCAEGPLESLAGAGPAPVASTSGYGKNHRKEEIITSLSASHRVPEQFMSQPAGVEELQSGIGESSKGHCLKSGARQAGPKVKAALDPW